ncbi:MULTISPECIES: type II secretion system minor pseudopilin GspK [unclassified Pseudomonas]|uniref:type II secretion system minor pseudopilin GspK n=1 Tax=unclassified Pseudomonas TaxID=196821 RepID=UPI0021C7B607|nr:MULTISPECIES: type II secretion system minor pseudopilin GspK [unclassified Pseudomonas]MCU1730557.1 type II secretion system minor pseudopilin GspK [Pseudomonas sp. 20P_3.2_Bac4]MCU1745510.1 type II secretion system minor pseudopilin GspK [Pseudomonas sp. 20P_3.2_Bac5]
MKSYSRTLPRQRGMAIISALLIAAVVAVIAAGMLTRQSVLTRSLEAEQCRVQSHAVLLGGLEVSRYVLLDSRKRDRLTRPDQPWAQLIQTVVPTPRMGPFEGRLVDQQGKFNLRNLLANERVDADQVRSFERLCEIIGIDAGLAQRISQRVIASYPRVPGPQVSEQSATQNSFASGRSTSPGYIHKPLPAALPMLRSLEGLRGLDGMNEALLARLDQFVSIIPVNAWVNANTASAEVLAAMVPGLSLTQARAAVAERDSGLWFIDRGDIGNRLRLPQLSIDGLKVGISSEWFLLHGQTRCEKRRVGMDALLHSPEQGVPKVIWSRPGV